MAGFEHRSVRTVKQRMDAERSARANRAVADALQAAEGGRMQTRELARAAGVSETHVANMAKAGFLIKMNPGRKPGESFVWKLAGT